jgi:hypothetical protein
VPLNTAMIGVIITYLTDGIPQEVTAEWDFFSERVQKVTARMTDPAGPFPYDLEPDDNVLKWTNYLKNYTIPTVDKIMVADSHLGVTVPLGSAICLGLFLPLAFIGRRRARRGKSLKSVIGLALLLVVGAGILSSVLQVPVGGTARASQVSDEDSKAILHSLLKNVYRAFDFREESDVYDKLAISVEGNLLTDIYLQHRKSLAVQQAGGAQAKVEEIEIHNVTVSDSNERDDGLEFWATWTVLGSVGHWGHIHSRQNQYEAILTLAADEGFWKITDMEMLEEKRLDPFAPKQAAGSG